MSSATAWIALREQRPADAWAAGELAGGGWIAAWRERPADADDAVEADARCVAPDGPAAWLSLVLPPAGVAILFDDPAVQGARRRVLDRWPAFGMTTLVRGGSHFAGALTAGADRAALADDPFAAVWPARLVAVGDGFVGASPTPVGPGLERYAGQPWPVEGFRD